MKKKAIQLLIGISILLLVANILIELFEKDNDEKIPGDVSVAVVDSLFGEVLDEYGIEREWIKRRKLFENVADSISHYYEIILPPDIPTPFIINDVKNKLNQPAIKLTSEEIGSYGTSNVKIFSNNVVKLIVKFKYDKKIHRPFAQLSFIIDNAGDMNGDDFLQLIKEPFPFAVAIIPSKENELKKNLIQEYDKEYALLLNDKIDDSQFRLSTSLSKGLLRGSVGSIVTSFHDAVFYIIDERSELYRSAVYNFIRDEFKRRGIRLRTRSWFVKMTSTDKEEIISLLDFYCTSGRSKEGKKILISAEGFESLSEEIEKAKKKGHKFVLPSKLNSSK
ncbi:hypothetical protein ACFLR4_03375 [Bacteroidota bacterium]